MTSDPIFFDDPQSPEPAWTEEKILDAAERLYAWVTAARSDRAKLMRLAIAHWFIRRLLTARQIASSMRTTEDNVARVKKEFTGHFLKRKR